MPSPLKEEPTLPSEDPWEQVRGEPSAEPRTRKKMLRWIILVAVVLGVGIFWKSHRGNGTGEAAGKGGSTHGGAVPVVVGSAAARDFPIYLSGLGTVQAYNSVVVKARVDG